VRHGAGHTACGLYAHITWHTWRRIPQLRASDVHLVCDSVLAAGRRSRVHVHAQAVLSDHVHVLVSYPPDVAVADFLREAKSESARRVNAARRDACPMVSGLLRWLSITESRHPGAVLLGTAVSTAPGSHSILARVG